jgi:hypothetical protein
MLKDVDWLAEIAEQERRLESGEESCPPGLGIDHPTKRILHICPNPSGSTVHYHYPHKIMGLFGSQRSATLEMVPQDQINSFIHAFFGQEWKLIESQA